MKRNAYAEKIIGKCYIKYRNGIAVRDKKEDGLSRLTSTIACKLNLETEIHIAKFFVLVFRFECFLCRRLI